MSFLLKKNNSRTVINQANGINASALSVVVADVNSFPNGGDFLATTWDKVKYPDPADDPNAEILKVTNVVNKTFTIERGQEDTVGKVHINGSAIEMLITAGTFEEIENEINTSVGNMTKAVYDTNDNEIVDKSESVDDGVGNSKTASEIKTHIDSTANPHSVDKSDVGLTSVPDLDTTNAVNNEHTQNTDTVLDEGGVNEIAASEIPKALNEYVEYYIAVTGNDVTGNGSFGNPFATINHALSVAPHFSKADDAFIQINIGAGTFTENVIIGGYQCAIYISGAGQDNTIINGSFRIKDSTYVNVINLQVNISGGYAFYTERSKIYCRRLKLSGGSNAVGFNTSAGSIIAYSKIKDGAVPIYAKFNSAVGSFILKDASAFATHEYSGSIEGFVSEGINLIKSEYEDLLFRKHSQNTDTKLDEGGANEVSAEEIRNHINATPVDNEELTSQIDGLTNSFTTTFNYIAGTLKVYVGGKRQTPGAGKDYIETGLNSFDLNYIPASTEKMIIDYKKLKR